MTLSDNEIAKRVHYNEDSLDISPYNETNLQPASYDLRLGRQFKILRKVSLRDKIVQTIKRLLPLSNAEPAHFDPVEDEVTEEVVNLNNEDGFILKPGEFVLGHTQEVVSIPDDLVGVVHGRSSWARIGINPHLGGYIDPGFEGQITLELSNLTDSAIKIRTGQRFCQIAFHELNEPASEPYRGKYQKDRGAKVTRLRDDVENNPPTIDKFLANR